jgi:hypothetical protein
MKKTKEVLKLHGKTVVRLQKDGERNSLVLIKQKDQDSEQFHLNIGRSNAVQGISLTREEFLNFANEIKEFVGGK